PTRSTVQPSPSDSSGEPPGRRPSGTFTILGAQFFALRVKTEHKKSRSTCGRRQNPGTTATAVWASYRAGDKIMASKDTSRRQGLSSNIKSAIATAAIVGTLGGWVAFGSQQAATAGTTTATSAPAVAQVAESSDTTAQSGSAATS